MPKRVSRSLWRTAASAVYGERLAGAIRSNSSGERSVAVTSIPCERRYAGDRRRLRRERLAEEAPARQDRLDRPRVGWATRHRLRAGCNLRASRSERKWTAPGSRRWSRRFRGECPRAALPVRREVFRAGEAAGAGRSRRIRSRSRQNCRAWAVVRPQQKKTANEASCERENRCPAQVLARQKKYRDGDQQKRCSRFSQNKSPRACTVRDHRQKAIATPEAKALALTRIGSFIPSAVTARELQCDRSEERGRRNPSR